MDYYLNRVICDVFHEMRKCNETKNFSYLEGLIEEAQSMANRMENGLGKKKQIEEIEKRWLKAKEKSKFLSALEEKEKELENE